VSMSSLSSPAPSRPDGALWRPERPRRFLFRPIFRMACHERTIRGGVKA
jgi:hypothetical protein